MKFTSNIEGKHVQIIFLTYLGVPSYIVHVKAHQVSQTIRHENSAQVQLHHLVYVPL